MVEAKRRRMTARLRVLFVTWDAPELAYLETLFLPIFAGLQPRGIAVDVLQFRWGDHDQTEKVCRLCEDAGIRYRHVQISRRFGPAGPLASAALGARAVRKAAAAFGSDVLMPRSLMPALAVLVAKSRLPVIFDADGLAADERVDFAGLSPGSMTYRLLRRIEAGMVRKSRIVLTRSARAQDILIERAKPDLAETTFHVVTNGRDADHYKPGDAASRSAARAELGIDPAAPLLVYAGSVGPQYRFDQMAALFAAVRKRSSAARLLVMSGDPVAARSALGAPADGVHFLRAAPTRVAHYLACADLGIACRLPAFSTQAVAPVKLAEYLLCGLPVIGTPGVGDTAAAADAGVFMDDGAGPEDGADWLLNAVMPERDRFRSTAQQVGLARFSLGRSIQDYAAAIEPLSTSNDGVPSNPVVAGIDA